MNNKYSLYANRWRLAMTAATAAVYASVLLLLLGVFDPPWYVYLGPLAASTWALYRIWGNLLHESDQS